MYQNFIRSVGYDEKGYSLLVKDLKIIKNIILISGSKSNYNYTLKKLSRIFKKKPKHILLNYNRGDLDLVDKIYMKNKKEFNTIIALGGGSIIDFSKRLVSKFRKYKKSYFYVIPTLLGSGAESSISSIINTPNNKSFIVDENFFPDGIIYDSNLIKTVSKLSLLTGILDSFSHCIESLTTINKNYYLNFLSIETLNSFIKKNSFNNLVYKNKFNYPDIATLSLNGGLAQSNAGAGICHALTHASEKILKINHSEGISFYITPVLKYLLTKNKEDLDAFDKKLFKYIFRLSKYTVEKLSLNKLKNSFKKKAFIHDLIDLSKNDICWKLYNKNIDEDLLVNFLKK